MEDMDAAAVASWLRGLGGLEAAADAAEREGVDGDVLLALAADETGLEEGLNITAALELAKIKGALARLARDNKRRAAPGGEPAAKRPRASLPATPLAPPGGDGGDGGGGSGADDSSDSWTGSNTGGPFPSGRILAMDTCAQGHLVATGSHDGAVRLWDSRERGERLVATFDAEGAKCVYSLQVCGARRRMTCACVRCAAVRDARRENTPSERRQRTGCLAGFRAADRRARRSRTSTTRT